MDKILLKIILGGFLSLIIFSIIFFDKNKIKIFKESMKPLHIKIYFIATILFYLFINFGINNQKINLINIDEDEYIRIKKIANQSLFGLSIALFAHLHLFITPFWIIFFLMYFKIFIPDS